MSSFLLRTAAAAFAVLAISTSAAAQEATASDSAASLVRENVSAAPAPEAVRTAPTILALTAPAAHPAPTFRPVHEPVATVVRRQPFDRPTTLMIVGGALIVTGLIVGSDAAPILYLAGAGIGGYGLYLHLQGANARLTR